MGRNEEVSGILSSMKTLITHINPHLDDVFAIWLLKKYDPKYQDFEVWLIDQNDEPLQNLEKSARSYPLYHEVMKPLGSSAGRNHAIFFS